MDDVKLAEMMKKLNKIDMTGIENQSMMRAIIDYQFNKNKKLYWFLLSMYIIFFCCPFAMYCNYLAHYNALNNVYENPWEDYSSNNPDMDALVQAVWEHEAKEHREAVCPPSFPYSFPKSKVGKADEATIGPNCCNIPLSPDGLCKGLSEPCHNKESGCKDWTKVEYGVIIDNHSLWLLIACLYQLTQCVFALIAGFSECMAGEIEKIEKMNIFFVTSQSIFMIVLLFIELGAIMGLEEIDRSRAD